MSAGNQDRKTFWTDLLQTIRTTVLVPIHPAGWPFAFAAAFITIVLGLLSQTLLTLGIIATLFVLYFFRDPARTAPDRKGLIVAPGDGLVTAIAENVPWPDEIEGAEMRTSTRISIFLSMLDVHVTRVALAGTVRQITHRAGEFLNAGSEAASRDNERCTTVIETEDGHILTQVQIAGLVARRIVNDLKTGEHVETGGRLGIIRFGSRIDIYLPAGVNPLVCVGQRTIGGETVLADLESDEAPRTGTRL